MKEEFYTIDNEIDRHFLSLELNKALSSLTVREQLVIRMICGFNDESLDYTLKDIGSKINLSTERVRQIGAKALRKLRHPSRRKELELFIYNDYIKNLYKGE